MQITVLDSFTADQGQVSCWEDLKALGALALYPRTSPAELVARAAGANALLTNKVALDSALIAKLPELRYVGILATGTNVVDLAACQERGIAVTNVPSYSTDSVAQLVFAMMLHFTHDVGGHGREVKAGGWARSPDFMFRIRPLSELSGKVLTILGMGAIGRRVADIARAFGMQVLAARVPGSTTEERVPLDEALAQSDFVSLHCPLTKSTQHLVGARFLANLRRGAVLINTGRGALIDEAALLRALASGALGGAALDVLAAEPPLASHPLLDPGATWAPRLLVTPHIGWATDEARARLVRAAIDNLAAFARGARHNRVV
jgi:glycerate dehydrogenase